MPKPSAMRGLTLYLLLVLVLVLLIYVPSPIGLADNSDFNRTLRAFGLTPDGDGTKYWSVGYHYRIANPSGIVRYFQERLIGRRTPPISHCLPSKTRSGYFAFLVRPRFCRTITGFPRLISAVPTKRASYRPTTRFITERSIPFSAYDRSCG